MPLLAAWLATGSVVPAPPPIETAFDSNAVPNSLHPFPCYSGCESWTSSPAIPRGVLYALTITRDGVVFLVSHHLDPDGSTDSISVTALVAANASVLWTANVPGEFAAWTEEPTDVALADDGSVLVITSRVIEVLDCPINPFGDTAIGHVRTLALSTVDRMAVWSNVDFTTPPENCVFAYPEKPLVEVSGVTVAVTVPGRPSLWLSLATGELLERKDLGLWSLAASAESQDVLLVAGERLTQPDMLYAMDFATGIERWRFEFTAQWAGWPWALNFDSDGDRVVLSRTVDCLDRSTNQPVRGAEMTAFEVLSGDIVWQTCLGGLDLISEGVLFSPDDARIFVVSDYADDFFLGALDAETGSILWATVVDTPTHTQEFSEPYMWADEVADVFEEALPPLQVNQTLFHSPPAPELPWASLRDLLLAAAEAGMTVLPDRIEAEGIPGAETEPVPLVILVANAYLENLHEILEKSDEDYDRNIGVLRHVVEDYMDGIFDTDWTVQFEIPLDFFGDRTIRGGADSAMDLAIDPTGQRLYVSGATLIAYAGAAPSGVDAVTMAFEPSNGKLEWMARYDGPRPGTSQLGRRVVHADDSGVVVFGPDAGAPTFIAYPYDPAPTNLAVPLLQAECEGSTTTSEVQLDCTASVNHSDSDATPG